MAKVKNYGYTDTATTATQLSRGALNFGADFRIKKDGGTSLVLANVTSPWDRTEEILMNFSTIKNIYDRYDIDPSVQAPQKKGVNLYTKLTDVYQITDDTDPSFVVQLPIGVSITLTSVQSEYLTADDIQRVLARAVSTLFDTGSETTTRLNAALRGSLKPSDL